MNSLHRIITKAKGIVELDSPVLLLYM